jgi:hypothetical protein
MPGTTRIVATADTYYDFAPAGRGGRGRPVMQRKPFGKAWTPMVIECFADGGTSEASRIVPLFAS